MTGPEWTPANDVEREMVTALEAGDGPAYARQLLAAPLLVPDLPEPGTVEEERLAELFPPGPPYVPVYTSEQSLRFGFGQLATAYHEVDFATLRQRWPDRDHHLAVNPGSPIATFLPPHTVDDLAAGRQGMLSFEEMDAAIQDVAADQIRRLVLADLAGRPAGAGAAGAGAERPEQPLREDRPANELEHRLRDTVDTGDGEGYLRALLEAEEVLLVTAVPVPDPDQIFEETFPWRVLGGAAAQAIGVFSSREMLERTATGTVHTVAVGFLAVLANWPGEEHTLYVNPGSVLELLLPGTVVLDVVDALAEGMTEDA